MLICMCSLSKNTEIIGWLLLIQDYLFPKNRKIQIHLLKTSFHWCGIDNEPVTQAVRSHGWDWATVFSSDFNEKQFIELFTLPCKSTPEREKNNLLKDCLEKLSFRNFELIYQANGFSMFTKMRGHLLHSALQQLKNSVKYANLWVGEEE